MVLFSFAFLEPQFAGVSLGSQIKISQTLKTPVTYIPFVFVNSKENYWMPESLQNSITTPSPWSFCPSLWSWWQLWSNTVPWVNLSLCWWTWYCNTRNIRTTLYWTKLRIPGWESSSPFLSSIVTVFFLYTILHFSEVQLTLPGS